MVLRNLFMAWKVFYLRKKKEKAKFRQFQRILNEKRKQKYFRFWTAQAREKEFEKKEIDYSKDFYRKKIMIKYFTSLVSKLLIYYLI